MPASIPKESWWNNGHIELKAVSCPKGFQKGRLQKINVGRTLKTKLKMDNIKITGTSKRRIEIIHPLTKDEKYIQERFLPNYLDLGYVLKRNKRRKKK